MFAFWHQIFVILAQKLKKKMWKNVRKITFFGCELSSVNYNGDFTLENDKDLKIKKIGLLECWLMFEWGTIHIKAVEVLGTL